MAFRYIHNKHQLLQCWNMFVSAMETKEFILFILFEIIIKVLVSSFWFIWIPLLWVYGHYIFLLSQRGDRLQTSESDVYRCQILMLGWFPLCKGWTLTHWFINVGTASEMVDQHCCSNGLISCVCLVNLLGSIKQINFYNACLTPQKTEFRGTQIIYIIMCHNVDRSKFVNMEGAKAKLIRWLLSW